MTLDELAGQLNALAEGAAVDLPYHEFKVLFPPGQPDDRARHTARQFALKHGCKAENLPNNRLMRFHKRSTI